MRETIKIIGLSLMVNGFVLMTFAIIALVAVIWSADKCREQGTPVMGIFSVVVCVTEIRR